MTILDEVLQAETNAATKIAEAEAAAVAVGVWLGERIG
jgi:hypothetical protein